MLAYAAGDVYFAPNMNGHLRIFNRKHEEWDIQGCRYNIPNKSVYCEVYVHFTYNFNGQQLLGFKPYRLRAPITSIEYIGNDQCGLKYGSTFKYTFLHTQDIKTGKYQNSQTLCTCNNENITYGYLPSKLYYGTPKQRFQFVTSSRCQFFAYYDVVISTELDIVIKH